MSSASPPTNSSALEALLLTPADEAVWLSANRRMQYNIFASFLAFNIIAVVSTSKLFMGRFLRDRKRVAQAQHGATALVHALFSIAIAAYTFSQRPNTELACGGRLFCFIPDDFLALDIHAGYLIYELAFLFNNQDIIKPQFRLLDVHHSMLIAGFFVAKAHPCTLTMVVLPWYHLMAVGQGAAALLDFSVALGKPTRDRLNTLFVLVVASLVRAIGALAISFKSWWYLSSRQVMQLDLGGGPRAALNAAYCVLFLGGGFVLATIYLFWFRSAVEALKATQMALAQRHVAAGAAAKKGATTAAATAAQAGGKPKIKSRRRVK